MKRLAADAADAEELLREMRMREAGVNRQLGETLFFVALAYLLCFICTYTGVFLTGRLLGAVSFLPGVFLMLAGAVLSIVRSRDAVPRPWVKYVLLALLFVSVLNISLIQLVWSVPCLFGLAAFVYAYMNVRMTVMFNVLMVIGAFVGAGMNAAYGMPNPDMLPYPDQISGVADGYVTLWAMRHPEAWNRWDYFLRVLRFHTLPLMFLMLIVAGAGFAMARRTRERLMRSLAIARRIREVEACLLMSAASFDVAPVDVSQTLSASFVATIPAKSIPDLMKRFRARCRVDAKFAELAAISPESALQRLLQTVKDDCKHKSPGI